MFSSFDATAETIYLGRLVNHSRTSPNCVPKVFRVKNTLKLLLVAIKNIKKGEEILYDYNEKRSEVIKKNPWLAD